MGPKDWIDSLEKALVVIAARDLINKKDPNGIYNALKYFLSEYPDTRTRSHEWMAEILGICREEVTRTRLMCRPDRKCHRKYDALRTLLRAALCALVCLLAAPALVRAAVIEAESGALAAPMTAVSDTAASGGQYVVSNTGESGSVTYTVSVPQTSVYEMWGRVFSTSGGDDSFYVCTDNPSCARDDANTWDLNPTGDPTQYGRWILEPLRKRGIGTFGAPEYNPYLVSLGTGTHTITVLAREAGARLDYLYLADMGAPAASTGDVTLAWDAPWTNIDGSLLTDLAGYKVHYGPSSRNYTQSIDVGLVTTYTVTGLSAGVYYFAITAYDTGAVESDYSNEIFKGVSIASYAVSPVWTGGGNMYCVSPVYSGQTSTCTLSPAANYHISTVTGCGGTWTSGSTYTTGAVVSACTVSATFTSPSASWQVTPSVSSHGSITPGTAQTAPDQGNLQFTVTPDSGYYFTGFSPLSSNCTGYVPESSTLYSIGPIVGDCAFTANFAQIIAGGGGLKSPGMNLKTNGFNLKRR